MAAGLHVGVNETLNLNTGTFGTPVWLPITIVGDLDITLDKSKAEVKARISTWRATLPAIKSLQLEFDMLADTTQSTMWQALITDFMTDVQVDFAIADQAIGGTGVEYLRAQFYCFGAPISQKLEEAEKGKFSFDLAYGSTPTWTN